MSENKKRDKSRKPLSLIQLEHIVDSNVNEDKNKKTSKYKDIKNKDIKNKDIKNKDIKNKDIKNKDIKNKDIKNKDIKNKDNNNKFKDNEFDKYILFLPLTLIYLELVLHIMINKSIEGYSLIKLLFSISLGLLLTFITRLFNEKINLILTWFMTLIISLYFIAQYIYFDIFKVYLSIYSIAAVGTDVLEFAAQLFDAIRSNIFAILLLLIPLVVMFVLSKGKRIEKKDKYSQTINLLLGVLLYMVAVVLMPLYGRATDSPYDLYYNIWDQSMSVEKLGLLPTSGREIKRLFAKNSGESLEDVTIIPNDDEKGTDSYRPEPSKPIENESQVGSDQKPEPGTDHEEVSPSPTPTPIPIDRTPNVLDIEFVKLVENETDNKLKKMHEYFSKVEPSRKNEYTGIFEGYNLIFITAEAFSPFAVDKEVTPTLYELVNSSFVFENFYTPLWWSSTIDGEYVAQTGLLPKPGVISFYGTADNHMPFALGNQFNKIGYNTSAYHNHTYTYYKRDVLYPNMGYTDYTGVGNGLEINKRWPSSDLEMIEVTIPEYINNEPFHTYYMTVSGHMNYTFMGNNMSQKNRSAVEHLPYSEEAKAYIACNIELDKALEKLILELEDKNIADKTVIALSSDHYPYGLEKKHIDQIAGHEVEENFELYKNHFILWSASIEDPIIIDKPSSSLDIVPTLSNLFALEYDSRLFAGRDILSDSDPLVIFSNRSFITDKVMYNSRTKEVINLTDEEVTNEYIENVKQIVTNKFIISESILDLDYYNHIGY